MSSADSDTAKPRSGRPPISIVIPALDEAHHLAPLQRQLQTQAIEIDVVLVDGGSSDGTAALARTLGFRTIQSPPGRGQQLTAGAAAAAGEVLLFLHADSQLPPGAVRKVLATLASNPDIGGGNFRLLFDGDDKFSRWLNGFYRWIRSHGFYYGDSAVFVRRTVYEALGGIRPIALMEDYDFIRRMERHGRTCCIADPPLLTSSRRFQGRHPIAIVYGWLKIHALFHLGVSPDRLARMYNSKRRHPTKAPVPQQPHHDPSSSPLSDQS